MNDVLRFWRTLCINYEAGTDHTPEKRRAKNFKLKYSRLLTCYSAIVGLQLKLHENGTVAQEQAAEIVSMKPLERIELASHFGAKENVKRIKEQYEYFLEETDCNKDELREKMRDSDYYGKVLESARLFGDEIFELIRTLAEHDTTGSQSWRFLRYITV